MKLIVGLGNPGLKYKNTRHNVGFMALSAYTEAKSLDGYSAKFEGEYLKFKHGEEDVILFKPLTYMNLSGIAVSQIINYFKIDLKDVLVIYDDKDLPFATLRLRNKGHAGTHNGMKNIIEQLNSIEFKRLRIGLGSPKDDQGMIDFVLEKFSKEELEVLKKCFEKTNKVIDYFIEGKFEIAMNEFNHEANN